MRKLSTIILILALINSNAFAFSDDNSSDELYVSKGELSGRAFDHITKEVLEFTNVVLKKDDRMLNGTTTDKDGFFTFKTLDPGSYTLELSYIGYKTNIIENVRVITDDITIVDVPMVSDATLPTLIVSAPSTPIITIGFDDFGHNLTDKDIQKLPVRDINDLIALGAGTYQKRGGDQLQVRGSRVGATKVIIDGMTVVDPSFGIPNNAIGSMKVLTGGIPAKYGDTSAGVVIIDTKGYNMGY